MSPAWTNDTLGPEHLIPGPFKLDAAQFRVADAVRVALTANAAQGAVALAVTALTGAIPVGTVLDFGGAKFARTTAAAAAGAVAVAVAALPTAMVIGDTAYYNPPGSVRYVPDSTIVGRTIAERDAGTGFGPAADTDDEIRVVAFAVRDADDNNDVELVRPGTNLLENFLAGWAEQSNTVKAKVRDLYVCSVGEA